MSVAQSCPCQPRITDGNSRIALSNEPFAEAMRLLMVLVASQPCDCFFDGLIRPRRREPHDHGVAKPLKCGLSVRRLKGTKNETAGCNHCLHVPFLFACRPMPRL